MARERVQIGSSQPQKKHLEALAKAYGCGELALFVGAGASVPYGVPTWEDLVTGLMLSEAGDRFKDFFPHYRTALASWLHREFDFSPVKLARVIKYNLRKRGGKSTLPDALQKRLYANLREPGSAPTLLDEIVRLILDKRGRIRRIVNFNFDDLLVHYIRAAGVHAYPRYGRDASRTDGLEILHPHGFVPRPGQPAPGQDLVFTEDEYNRITLEPLNWAATEVATTLHNSVGFFLGLSMNDPNLRRILDSVGRLPGKQPRHYLLRLDYGLEHIDLDAAVIEVQRLAGSEFDRRSPNVSGPARDNWTKKSAEDVKAAIKKALTQAHVYDRELFKDLGVGTVWVNDFTDMPRVIEWIRKRATRPVPRK